MNTIKQESEDRAHAYEARVKNKIKYRFMS